MIIKSASVKNTQKFAELLVKKIKKYQTSNIKQKHTAITIGLVGELGAGKTTFIQGFAKALQIKHRLVSPTFLIIRSYKIPNQHQAPNIRHRTSNTKHLYHIDAYRLHNYQELVNLDFSKIISKPQNIVIVEWADKIKKILPDNTIWLQFEHGKKENERIIKINH